MKVLKLATVLIILNCVHFSLQDDAIGLDHDTHGKIIHGQSVRSNEMPFFASIWMLHKDYKESEYLCAGVFVKPDLVLTSHNCVFHSKRPTNKTGTLVIVYNHNNRISVNDLTSKYLFCSPVEIYLHQKTPNSSLISDLMVFRLRHSVYEDIEGSEVEGKIRPVEILAIENYNDLNGRLKVAGYDDPVDNKGTRYLKHLYYEILPSAKCYQHFDKLFSPSANICGIKRMHEIAFPCQGNDGGPVLMNDKKGWKLVAIMTNSFKCESDRSWELFTRIDYHWINKIYRNQTKPTRTISPTQVYPFKLNYANGFKPETSTSVDISEDQAEVSSRAMPSTSKCLTSSTTKKVKTTNGPISIHIYPRTSDDEEAE